MDVRRCRRCKRKRLDDEPDEVRQYKTCAKCRIIERNKKNSRKPLAEETMLYGLKQFREQQSAENYIEEEGLLKDEFFKRYHNKPFNYQEEITKVLNNPNYVPPVLHNHNTDEVVTSSNGNTTGPKYQMTMKTNNTTGVQPPIKSRKQQQQQPQQQQQQTQQHRHQQHQHQHQQQTHHHNQLHHQQETVIVDDEEDLYKILSELGNDDNSAKNDSKIIKENLDPYANDNVYDDFQKYLTTILEKLHSDKDIKNLVYLKEFNEVFTTNMSKFDAYTKDRTTLYQSIRLSEKQFRSHLLSNIRAMYIDPIIACLGLLYKQEYTNINEFKSTTSIKCGFSYIAKSAEQDEIKNLKESSIILVYNKKYHLLVIKLNHTSYRPSEIIYPNEFKQKVASVFGLLQMEEYSPESTAIFQNINLDYNAITGGLVYDKLVSVSHTYSEELQKFLKGLDKDVFIADFVNYEKVFKLDEENGVNDDDDDMDVDEEKPENKEEEQPQQQEQEGDVDVKMDVEEDGDHELENDVSQANKNDNESESVGQTEEEEEEEEEEEIQVEEAHVPSDELELALGESLAIENDNESENEINQTTTTFVSNENKEDDNNNDDILTKKESTVEVLDPVFQF
ncbi:hypothetical protein MGE_01554 [Candida albicans P75010]|nr:hypothetical protein MGE_01554 [Candida albicans P75010]